MEEVAEDVVSIEKITNAECKTTFRMQANAGRHAGGTTDRIAKTLKHIT